MLHQLLKLRLKPRLAALLLPLALPLTVLLGPSARAETCDFSITQIGPREVRVRGAASYLFRVENVGNCSLLYVDAMAQLPTYTRFRRSDPPPEHVDPNEAPEGARMYWGFDSRPGEVALFEVGIYVLGTPRTMRNEFCVEHPELPEGKLCRRFKVEVVD